MIPATQVQSTFVGGEVSPSLSGRYDIDRYSTSGTTMENFLPTVEGPIKKRTGTQVIGAGGAYTASAGRLVAFNSRTFHCSLLFDGTSMIPWGVTDIAEEVTVALPYTLGVLPYLNIHQVNDVLFITHPLYPPARLARYGVGDWAYEILPLEGGPYLDYTTEDLGISLRLNVTSDRMTLVSTATDFAGRLVDDYIEYSTGSATAVGKIKTYVSDYEVSIEPLQERCFSLSKETYALGLFMGYGSNGSSPYDTATAANYRPLHGPTSYATQNALQVGGYYRIAIVGTTDFTLYGAASNTVLLGFFATSTQTPFPGTGMVINDNVGFSNTQVVTNNQTGNYLQFADIKGQRRWMYIRGRRDVPEQSAYGVIACGETLFLNGNVSPQPYTGTITQGERSIIGTLTASSAVFTANDVGRWYRLEYGSNVVDVKVTAYTSATLVSVSALRPLPLSGYGSERTMEGTTTTWRRGSFYIGNYPRCAAFHEGRLCFAGTYLEPQTFWLSKSGDYYGFAPTTEDSRVEDDSAITATLASDVYQEIRDMTSRTTLSLLTSSSEWVVTSGQGRDPLTPKNVTARRESSYGSDFVQSIQSGRSTLFVQESGMRVRELTYDYSVDANIPLDVTVFSGHLFRQHGAAVELHYLRRPVPTVLALTSLGQIAIMVYEPDQKVYAWSRLVLGGPGDPKVKSMCVLHAGNYTGEDVLWLLVERSGIYTVERAHTSYEPSSPTDTLTAYYHMDSAVSVSLGGVTDNGNGTSSVSLATRPWLQNTTVCVLVDDQIYTNIATTTTITIPAVPASRLWIGFAYTAHYVSMPIHYEGRAGHTLGHKRKITGVTFRVKDSLDFRYGISVGGAAQLSTYGVRTLEDPVNRIPYLRSLDVDVVPASAFASTSCLDLRSELPYPLTVQAISYNITQTN